MNTIKKVLAYMVIDQSIYSFNFNITVIMKIYSSKNAPTIVSYYSQFEESKMFNLVSNK